MKRIWTAALLAIMLLSACCPACAESTPLIYRVTDAEGHRIYLLGTIHVGREDMYPWSDAVEKAFEEADVLAVEVDIQNVTGNFVELIKYSVSLVYGLNDDAANHLSAETYQLGIEKLGYPEVLLKRMRPVAWYSLAEEYAYSLAGLSSDWGVDMQLLAKAKKANKKIEETESLEAQMETLLALPDEVLDGQIREILSDPASAAESVQWLARIWQAGDQKLMEAMLSMGEAAGGDEGAYDEYNDTLIYSRNEGFEEQAKEYLRNGTVAMIAIGAFHIVGQDGLAARLARAGYTVEEIGR